MDDKINQNQEEEILDKEQKDDSGKKRAKNSVIREVAFYVCLFIVAILILPRYVAQRSVVDGDSMQNNYYHGQSVIVEKISIRLDKIKRFDVITFHPKEEVKEEYYIKRVIGLPGETIQIKGSDIYINDKKLKENYGKDPIDYAGIAVNPIKLGEDQYFVLGDNRGISKDSRDETVGIIDKKYIRGRVILRVWPLSDFGVPK